MSTCSIQNGGKRTLRHLKYSRKGGKKTRGKKSYHGGNEGLETAAPAPASVPAPAPAPAPAPVEQSSQGSGMLAGITSGFSSFTKTVGDSVKQGIETIKAANKPKQELASNSMPSEQTGGKRRKKSKIARKSRKMHRLKRKRSRKTKK